MKTTERSFNATLNRGPFPRDAAEAFTWADGGIRRLVDLARQPEAVLFLAAAGGMVLGCLVKRR